MPLDAMQFAIYANEKYFAQIIAAVPDDATVKTVGDVATVGCEVTVLHPTAGPVMRAKLVDPGWWRLESDPNFVRIEQEPMDLEIERGAMPH